MKPVRYPESIFCGECHEHVQMVDCRFLSEKKSTVEFDYVCVSCGHRASAVRDWEYLQFSEREFCKKNGLVASETKGLGVVYHRVAPNKFELKPLEKKAASKAKKPTAKKARKTAVKA
jgi:hypothetical protein